MKPKHRKGRRNAWREKESVACRTTEESIEESEHLICYMQWCRRGGVRVEPPSCDLTGVQPTNVVACFGNKSI